MSVVEEYISKVKDNWFIYEPALFMVLCSFPVELSTKTPNIMTGARNIKVNGDFFSDKSYEVFEDYLRAECIRILLEHPFKRSLPIAELAYISSNILIGLYFKFDNIKFPDKESVHIHHDASYEDIYKELCDKVKKMCENMSGKGAGSSSGEGGQGDGSDGSGTCSGDSQDESSKNRPDYSKMLGDGYNQPYGKDSAKANSSEWGYDELSKALVGKIKQKIAATNSWGSLPNDLVSIIMADDAPEYNYKTAIRRFRKNVISTEVELTRMKPNRRYGYEQMGKKRSYKSNLLLICDTSGSMTDYAIGRFCGFVNKFFSYGMSDIDTITFDVNVLDSTLRNIRQKVQFIKTESRGGTDISDILDYVNNRSKKQYTGVIVFTDGWFDYDEKRWAEEMGTVRYLFCIIDENGFDHFNKNKDKRIESSYIQL